MRMFHLKMIDAVATIASPDGPEELASSQSTFSIEIGNERTRLPVA